MMMKKYVLVWFASFFLMWQISGGMAASQDLGDLVLSSSKGKKQLENPKLSPAFNDLMKTMATEGLRGTQAFSVAQGLDMADGLVWAVIEVDADPTADLSDELRDMLRGQVESLGGTWELAYRNQVQVWLPVDALEIITDLPQVLYVRQPIKMTPPSDPIKLMDPESEIDSERTTQATEVISQGVSLIGADDWQVAGISGSGVKVAVIDGGFKGYSTLLGSELPATVQVNAQGNATKLDSSVHGTACAEIIHDIAPNASLYLVRAETIVELGTAKDWCKTQGIKIISYSNTYFYGPFDGTGQINDIVNDAINNGIIWVNSAGNYAKSHWSGNFSDVNGDDFHDFTSLTDVNVITDSNRGDPLSIYMTWNDTWGSSSNDYDLYLASISPFAIVDSSKMEQNGNDNPFEYISGYPQAGYYFGFGIKKYVGAIKKLHVFVPNYILQFQTAATSVSIPADNEKAISVGAVAWGSPSVIEAFSSRGPTVDGRIKPDLVAPDRVSTVSFGTSNFYGTSPSCAHVAGACALVKQQNPSWTPAQVKSYLQSNAVDLGTAGKDSTYGSGRILLPAPEPVASHIYYIPYFLEDSDFWTGLALKNTSTAEVAHVTVEGIRKTGSLINSQVKTIPSRGQAAFFMQPGEGWAKVSSDKPLTGLAFITERAGAGLMFDITLIPALGKKLHVPHVAQYEDFDTIVYVCNPNDAETIIYLTFVKIDGQVVVSKKYTLPANGSGVFPLSGVLGGGSYLNGSVEISASQEGVAAFALYHNLKTGLSSYAGISAVAP